MHTIRINYPFVTHSL